MLKKKNRIIWALGPVYVGNINFMIVLKYVQLIL